MASTNSVKGRSMKALQSLRSVQSVNSRAFDNDDVEEDLLFEALLPKTCGRFQCSYPVFVKKAFQRDDFLKRLKMEPKTKYKRISVVPPVHHRGKNDEFALPDADAVTTTGSIACFDEPTIVLTALYDSMNRLAEIVLHKVKEVPRVLMQTIALLAPNYEQLTKISITKCGIDVYVIHELNKMLPITSLVDICLDESPLREGNYAILLEKSTRLRSLSLCRCRLNDKVCKQIASHLHYLCPVENTLTILNLSSNQITDKGLVHLGEALRSNRHLRYLNLADNLITDEGANHIFNVLMEFPLTLDELIHKKERYFTYLRAKIALYKQFLKDFDQKRSSEDVNRKGKKGKKSATPSEKSNKSPKSPISQTPTMGMPSEEFIRTRADVLAGEAVGPFHDPFSSEMIKGEWSHCTGNMVLTYLNLSYNNLSYMSLKKILKVLHYQGIHAKLNEAGLMRILVEGNYMPAWCSEMESIQSLLLKNLSRFGGRSYGDMGRRKSRLSKTRILSIPETGAQSTASIR